MKNLVKSSTDQVLVVLNVSPALEDAVTDWLLLQEGGGGFTSLSTAGHSSVHHGFSPGELVRGSKRQVQFQVQLPAANLDAFLLQAHENFKNSDVFFWVVPVIVSGQLRDLLNLR